MADEVFYSEGKLVSGRGPSIPRTALAGGDELFFTEITTNFTSSSTSFIDVTGLTGTLTVPEGPYIVELFIPGSIPTTNVEMNAQLVDGSGTLLAVDRYIADAGGASQVLFMKARVPYSMHSPAPGSSQTYKAQIKSSTTATAVSVFVDFGSRLNPCFIRAYRT